MTITEKNEIKKELMSCLDLLNSPDEESKLLGYKLFQTSKFRKYIRNKVYAHRSSPRIIYKFPLYSLIKIKENSKEWKKDDIIVSNEKKIIEVIKIIHKYIYNKIIIYDRSYLGRTGIRRT